jgi:hypothetical protein
VLSLEPHFPFGKHERESRTASGAVRLARNYRPELLYWTNAPAAMSDLVTRSALKLASLELEIHFQAYLASIASTLWQNGLIGDTPHSDPQSDHNPCSSSSLSADAEVRKGTLQICLTPCRLPELQRRRPPWAAAGPGGVDLTIAHRAIEDDAAVTSITVRRTAPSRQVW